MIFGCEVGGPIIFYFKWDEYVQVGHVGRRVDFRLGIVLVKGHGGCFDGPRAVRFADAPRPAGRDGLSIHCGVRFFVLLYPRMVVLHCRRWIAHVRFVFPMGGLDACAFVVCIDPFVKATCRGHLIRSIFFMTTNRNVSRLITACRLCVQGSTCFCLERQGALIFDGRLPGLDNVPWGAEQLGLACRLYRVGLCSVRSVSFRYLNDGYQALLFSCQERLDHVSRRRWAAPYAKVSGLRRVVRRASNARRQAKRAFVQGRKDLVCGVWYVDDRVVVG